MKKCQVPVYQHSTLKSMSLGSNLFALSNKSAFKWPVYLFASHCQENGCTKHVFTFLSKNDETRTRQSNGWSNETWGESQMPNKRLYDFLSIFGSNEDEKSCRKQTPNYYWQLLQNLKSILLYDSLRF